MAYREENGKFQDRKDLLKVAKLGPKAFEQCAGFMRIQGGKNPLDATGVHPESYGATENYWRDRDLRWRMWQEGICPVCPKQLKITKAVSRAGNRRNHTP